jgi:soluble lytic murein transglycosylase-like protein
MGSRCKWSPCWLALCCLAGAACADIYTFTDEQGVVHFSNVPHEERYAVLIASAPRVSRAGERISAGRLRASARFDPLIERAALGAGVEPELLRAVIVVESGFDAAAVSAKGARGLMQLMPATARAYGAADAGDPAQNVNAGALYLRHLIDRYGDDLALALAAYNAGESAVARYGDTVPPFRETRAYVPRVLRVYRALCEARDRLRTHYSELLPSAS